VVECGIMADLPRSGVNEHLDMGGHEELTRYSEVSLPLLV
jgi:hypothetical protein